MWQCESVRCVATETRETNLSLFGTFSQSAAGGTGCVPKVSPTGDMSYLNDRFGNHNERRTFFS